MLFAVQLLQRKWLMFERMCVPSFFDMGRGEATERETEEKRMKEYNRDEKRRRERMECRDKEWRESDPNTGYYPEDPRRRYTGDTEGTIDTRPLC